MNVDDRVDVHFGGNRLSGHISRIVPQRKDDRPIKVVFDDPLVYGGAGAGWFRADQLSRPGELPTPQPERTHDDEHQRTD